MSSVEGAVLRGGAARSTRRFPAVPMVAGWVRRFATYWWLTAVSLVVWEIWARNHKSVFFPPFSKIWGRMVDIWFSAPASDLFVTQAFKDDVGTSLKRLGEGWGISVVLGITLGVALGSWRPLAAFFNPLVRFSMAIPATAILPVAIVLFGINDRMNVFLITFGTLWTVLVHAMDGVQGVETGALLAARSLRLSPWRYFFHVVLPAASPRIFAGLRVSLGIGLILMVVSELFAATEGVGYFLVYSQKSFAYLDMWAAILLIGILGVLINGAFGLLERRVMRWHLLQQRHVGSAL